MKRSEKILILVAILVFLGVAGWVVLYQSPKPAGTLTLTALPNSVGKATTPGMATFRLQNDGSRDIMLNEIFVEVKSSGGWLTVSNTDQIADRMVGVGKSKEIPIEAPSGSEPWRLRIAYIEELKGVKLLMAKVQFAIYRHELPPANVEVLGGINSVSSPEVSR